MPMKSAPRYLAIVSVMFLPAAAAAENLQQAWSDAIASHNQLAAAALRREAAGLNLESAQAERWPRLDVTSSFTQLDEAPRFDFGGGTTSQPLFDNDNFMQAGVQVSLPLYAGGAISAGVGAAEFAAEASEEQYGAMLQNIKLGTGEHYVQVLRAESGLEVAESNVRTLQAHTELARRQYEFGSVPKNDFLAASVALADAEQRKLQAENALDYSRAAYNRFLNRPLDHADPDRHGAAQRTRGAESRGELAARELDRHTRTITPAVRADRWLHVPGERIPHGRRVLDGRGLIPVEPVQRRTQPGPRRRARTTGTCGQPHTRTRVAEAAVDQAIENLRVVQNRYEAGSSANIEVLDAETLRQQALNNRDNARYELVLAKLRLARAVGAL
jgi:outer membrane protein TolC